MPESVLSFPLGQLDGCPICGSAPRRSRRRDAKGVVCFAGSHRLEALADTQVEADRIWNEMAADWARRNSREGQVARSLRIVEAIASIQHIAEAVDRGGLDTHSSQLREAARVFAAAFQETTNA